MELNPQEVPLHVEVNHSYYWDKPDSALAPVTTKALHWSYWSCVKLFEGMEFGGEIIATFLGLTRSKYDWILEAKEREEQEKALCQLEKRQRKQLRLKELLEQEKIKLAELERGSAKSDEEKADIML
ncbi:hypothetical protein THRCLA_21946 [Thraustotheca clavata]|uniref:Uncharacterized protein n=1 Tax=Thraustotheca clavata TaxID=74557 RepID=A0A1V9ZH78_9STRA|nr:hypothetical protein THRCLA_21946 [Thraustotheca clavata]